MTSTTLSSSAVLRAKRATSTSFLIGGLGMASWAPMVPFAKARLGIDEGALGLVMLAMGAGALVAMPLAGFLGARFGTRIAILISGIILAGSMPMLAIAPSPFALAILLFVFGAGMGSIDVAMNGQAVTVEREIGRPTMSWFHGLFSVGALLGAVGMTALLNLGLPLIHTVLLLSSGMLIALAILFPHLLADADPARQTGERRRLTLPRGTVLLLGLLTLLAFQAEGAVLDWSAVFLRNFRDFSAENAGLGYAAFSVAMAAVRLTGDRLNALVGARSLMVGGALIAATGFLLATTIPSGAVALFGFFMVGLGIANLAPILISAAGRVPGVAPAAAVSVVVIIGYAGLLAGPPLLGLVARATTLPVALTLVAVALVVIAASGRILGPRRR